MENEKTNISSNIDNDYGEICFDVILSTLTKLRIFKIIEYNKEKKSLKKKIILDEINVLRKEEDILLKGLDTDKKIYNKALNVYAKKIRKIYSSNA